VTLAHGGHVTGVDLLPVVVLVATAGGYLALVARHRGRGRRWSRWRTASFLTGVALLTVAVLVPAGDFHRHMAQHLLIGMYAPLALVLAAPVTLLLASLRPDRARRLTRLLRGGPARVLAHPVTALVLNVGGLVALYFTPLYQTTTTNPTLHHLVHAHFLAAGFLFAWVIAGTDPAPHRPGVPARLVVLGVAIAAHAVLAQLIYAGALVDVPVPEQERRAAGDLMYYGGDTAELLLALALLATWRPTGRHRPGPRPALAEHPVDQRYTRK
jgi:putative membrane protein